MSRMVPKSQTAAVPPQTATFKLRFGEKHREKANEEQPVLRVPRVARLLALAHRIEGMIRSGELKDWSEAARLIGMTRARMTQIANLLLVAPEIQEDILGSPPASRGNDAVTEHDLRVIVMPVDWKKHHVAWLTVTDDTRTIRPSMPPSGQCRLGNRASTMKSS